VIHEIKAECARRTGVEGGEDAGLAIGRDSGGVVETRRAQQPNGQLATFGNTAILRSDGRLVDPFLEPPNGLVVARFNLRAETIQVVCCGPSALRPSDSGRARGGSLEESSSVHGLLIAVKSARYNSNFGASLLSVEWTRTRLRSSD